MLTEPVSSQVPVPLPDDPYVAIPLQPQSPDHSTYSCFITYDLYPTRGLHFTIGQRLSVTDDEGHGLDDEGRSVESDGLCDIRDLFGLVIPLEMAKSSFCVISSMPSHYHKKFHWGTVFATGRRSFIKLRTGHRMKKTNRRTRVPIDLYPCHIEEKMTIKDVKGESVMEWKTKVTTKDGIVTKFLGKFHGYKLATEEKVEENEGLKEVTANVNNANGGNGNGGNNGCSYKTFTACNPKEFDGKGGAVVLTRWIEKIESVFDNCGFQARGREVAIAISWNDFKALLMEEFCPSNEIEKLENEFWNPTMVRANHVAYTDRFHELAKLVPHLVTPESSRIKRYINGLAPQICGMLRATQPTTIHSAILMAGILTNEAVRCGTLTKGNDKRKEMEESSKKGSTWKDNKKLKTRKGFVVTVPYWNDNGRIRRHVMNVYHLRYDCPKWKQATGQARNPLALEGNKNTRNNGNRARGGAFNENAVEALQDPKVVTVTFSLNNHFATVLFDSGADFSFISTKFVPVLNVESSIVNPGYVIEIADGKSVEVDSISRDCKLELENSLFTIDLIPLGYGSFDVIVGIDWLSKNKALIVCHEKVVEIPIEKNRILRVHGERTLGAAKALMNAKVAEPRISDIPVVQDFADVFPEDLLGLPPQQQVEFRIDVIPRATPVAKSPYRLAPSKMQELSGQLQEAQDYGFITPSPFHRREPQYNTEETHQQHNPPKPQSSHIKQQDKQHQNCVIRIRRRMGFFCDIGIGSCVVSIQEPLDTAYRMEIVLVQNVDQSILYGVAADVDTAYSLKSGNGLDLF
ncbi:putative reverse transcriptase domain-containing protein [Tanacetum coccineum]